MKKTKNNKNSGFNTAWTSFKKMLEFNYAGYATWLIFFTLFILSGLGSLQYNSDIQIFIPGETATNDVYASRTLKIEDTQATQVRRDQHIALQPLLFDLDKKSIQNFRDEILSLLTTVSSFSKESTVNKKTQETFNKRYKTELGKNFFATLALPKVQNYLTTNLLPFAEKILLQGIFPDRNQLVGVQGTILVRDAELGNELLLIPGKNVLPDLNSFYLSIGQELRSSHLSTEEKSDILTLFKIVTKPSLVINKEESIKRAQEIASTIPSVYYYIQKGERVVSKGAIVTREQHLKMQALYKYSKRAIDYTKAFGIFIISSCLAIGLFISPTTSINTKLHKTPQLFIAFLLFIFALLAITFNITIGPIASYAYESYYYLFPIASAGALSALIFATKRHLCIALLVSFFVTIFLNGSIELFFFFFLSTILNTFLILKSQSRQDIIKSTLLLLFGHYIIGFACALFSTMEVSQFPSLFLVLTLNTIFSLFLTFALSPLSEILFRLTTRFRLMELMNLEQPLLQELMMNAPGTYHHSIIVSNLAEAAAKAANANSLLCKVAAFYHDIGKIVRPDYFIENQINIPNKHNQLAPAMSALIILSHVKKGVELAEKYGLGKEIIDIITEHHGNRCIQYFYNKAKASHSGEGDPPKESDYSYPNIRPRSKEAAIIMLADAVEASSRTLTEPTPARIQSHVKNIVHGIYEEGQLDDSDLTFRDLTLISEAFVRSINGIFHQRIVYPEKK